MEQTPPQSSLPKSQRPATAAFAVDLALLLLALTCVYLPTMLHVPMRSTGDEKTYIEQALEMARHDTWFKQTLFDEPNYYKGPLFYVLLRLGFELFGTSSAAALDYMNTVGFGVAAVAMAYLLHRRLPNNHGATLLGPAIVVFSCGGYAHALASQMEALLIAFYAIFMVALGLGDLTRREGWRWRAVAWMVAGAAGWLKSPVHAVLLSSSALLFWLMKGELLTMARRWREWGAALLGVATGIAGYLPAYFYDRGPFVETYLLRENFSKGGGNGVGIDDALMPFFSAHLLPWSPLLLAGLWSCLRYIKKSQVTTQTGTRLLYLLATAVILPTVLFFVVHPYRNGIYILPILPGVALLIATTWAQAASQVGQSWRPFRIAQWTACGVIAIVGIALSIIIWRLSPWPVWWGKFTSAWVIACMAASVCGLCAAALVTDKRRQVYASLLGAAVFFLGAGRVLTALNDHDRTGVDAVNLPGGAPWLHVNLHAHLWSETGLLNPVLKHQVRGVYSPLGIAKAMVPGQVFLVPDSDQLAVLQKTVPANTSLLIQPWPRWLIHGETASGEPAWLQAWRDRSLASLEREEYLVTVVATQMATQQPASNHPDTTAAGSPSPEEHAL